MVPKRHEGLRRSDRANYLPYLHILFREFSWGFSYPEWFAAHSSGVNTYLRNAAQSCQTEYAEFEKALRQGSVVSLVTLGRKMVLQLYLLKPHIENTLVSLPTAHTITDRLNLKDIKTEFEELLLEFDTLPDELMFVLKKLEKKELSEGELQLISDKYTVIFNDFMNSFPDRFKAAAVRIHKPILDMICQIWLIRKLMLEEEGQYVSLG
jgi:hypothetical protein